MRLTNRFKDQLDARLSQFAAESSNWQSDTVMCTEENLSLNASNGIKELWQLCVSIEGTVRIEIQLDDLGEISVSPLIDNLINDIISLHPSDDMLIGELSESARFLLREWTVLTKVVESDIPQSVGVLLFQVSGNIVKKIDSVSTPEMLFSQVPKIGPAHESDYEPIDQFL